MDIEALMQQMMAGPTDEQKRAARAQALAAAGFGILGANSGSGWQGAVRSLGRGGLLGMNVYNNELANQQAAPMQNMEMLSKLMDFQGKKQAYEDSNAARDAIKSFQMPAPLPSMSPTNANAQSLASAPKVGNFERLNAMADALESKGLVQQAQTYRQLAEKYAPQYDGTETLMQDGKPVVMQKFKNRAPEAMQGYQPKPDYKQLDTGGQVGFYDPLTGTFGGRFDKSQTPDSLASNAISQARLAFDKAKDVRDQQGGGNVKPQWDSSSGQFVYPPSESAPQGKAVIPEGYQGKNSVGLLASQKALAAVGEAKNILDDATGSYLGAGVDLAARSVGASTQGAKAIAKLKVLESNIMMNQPRMEGPQSNMDVMMYRQAAGQIGDPTVPVDIKRAALEVIESMHKKYANLSGAQKNVGATGGWSISEVK